MSQKTKLAALLVLAALPLFLRLWPIAHGAPRNYVPDTHVVKNALGMAKDRDLIPPVGKYSSYPYLLPYLLLPVYAGEYVAGRATGAWNGAQEFALRAIDSPAIVQLPARALVALLGAATAAAAFLAARALGWRRGAWASAALSATSLLDVHLSLHERPWAPLVFFGTLAIWPAALHLRSGRGLHLAASGVCAALAFACHQAGLAYLGVPAFFWLFGPVGWRASDLRRRLAQGVACVAAFAVVALLVGHPYYLRYGLVPGDAVVGGDQASDKVSIGGQAVAFGLSWSGMRHMLGSMLAYDPVAVALGAVGAWLARRERTVLPLVLFTLAAGIFFVTNPSDHVRYMLPVVALLAVLAGRAFEPLLASRAGVTFALALLAWPCAQAIRLGVVLRRDDTRAQAERVLADLPAGSRVAIDHYGPQVELSLAALERLASLRPLRTREASRLELLKADAYPPERLGIDALYVEDLCAVDPATGAYGVRAELRDRAATPLELLRDFGATHVLLVDRGEHDDGSRIAAELAGAPAVATISPHVGAGESAPLATASVAGEAFLPTEMRNPLRALWTVERAGPRMRLVALDRP